MGKLGAKEYPDITLDSAVNYLNKAYRVLSEGIEAEGLAQALELKLHTGNFARAMSGLRKYGLIEGHGTIKATELAKQILYGFTQQDKDKARAQAWLNVEIIREIYQRYKTSIPQGGEFLATLSKVTGADAAEVQSKAGPTRNLLAEAVKDLKVLEQLETQQLMPFLTAEQVAPSAPEQPITPVTPSGLIDAKLGDVYIRIPRTDEGLKIARQLIDLLALQLGKPTPSDISLEIAKIRTKEREQQSEWKRSAHC